MTLVSHQYYIGTILHDTKQHCYDTITTVTRLKIVLFGALMVDLTTMRDVLAEHVIMPAQLFLCGILMFDMVDMQALNDMHMSRSMYTLCMLTLMPELLCFASSWQHPCCRHGVKSLVGEFTPNGHQPKMSTH